MSNNLLQGIGEIKQERTILEKNALNKKYIYGGGSAFHWVYEILIRNYGYSIDGVIDNKFKVGDYLDGIPCFSLNEFSSSGVCKSSLIIITVSDKVVSGAICNDLANLGFANIATLHQIYEVHDPFLSRQNISFENSFSKIEEAFSLLSDEKSRRIYSALIKTHIGRVPKTVEFEHESQQNFDEKIAKLIDYSNLCVCGCGVHDLKIIIKNCKDNLKKLTCFEPDPWNYNGCDSYQGLLSYISNIQNEIDFSISAFQVAVSNHGKIREFASANDLPMHRTSKTTFGSKIGRHGKNLIQTIALDNFFVEDSPTAIIIDAEGEEPNIIEGSVRIIREDSPSLAIATYHNISHLWELPIMINKANPNYNFFIRNYTGYSAETVLYGVSNG